MTTVFISTTSSSEEQHSSETFKLFASYLLPCSVPSLPPPFPLLTPSLSIPSPFLFFSYLFSSLLLTPFLSGFTVMSGHSFRTSGSSKHRSTETSLSSITTSVSETRGFCMWCVQRVILSSNDQISERVMRCMLRPSQGMVKRTMRGRESWC